MIGLTSALTGCGSSMVADPEQLEVVLIPADGGTESGTKADFNPVFEAVARQSGLGFKLAVAQSYGAVVEALCSGNADVAFLGPVTYIQARERGCADFLAVAQENGQSQYFAGLFVRGQSQIREIDQIRGKRVAFGDINSTSSFVVPIGMILAAGIDPTQDLSKIALLGSHANSLAALLAGQVDVAALSFESFDKALAAGVLKAEDVRVIARSDPIPYPPLAMRSSLNAVTKDKLRQGFNAVASDPEANASMIRGYGGKKVDGYSSDFDPSAYDQIAGYSNSITPQMLSEILATASQR